VRGLAKLAAVELKLFLRDPLAVIFAFAFPFFVLFILAGVFGNDPEPPDSEDAEVWRGVGPTDYYVPAYVGLVMASVSVITLPLRLATYRERGVLKRFRAAGVPLAAVVGSQVAVALAMSVFGGIAITVAGMAVYGTPFPEFPLRTLAAFALSAAAFAAFGVFLGSVLPTARAAQGAGLVLFFMMMFISGAGPPREVLTDPMRMLSNVLPLTHVVLVLQEPWLGFGWETTASLVLAGVFVVSSILAWRFFRWE
jgi:ABC-2 type transport system permease protein